MLRRGAPAEDAHEHTHRTAGPVAAVATVSPSATTKVGRAPRRARIPDWALPWIGVLAVLLLFELASRTELIASRYFPPVTESLSALADQVGSGSFWASVGQTLQGWALGLGIAIVIAVPVGIVLGSSRLAYRAMRAVIEFLRPIPSVALIPLAVLVYGTGLQSKVFLAAFASTWPLLVQTLYGVQDVDPVAADTARSFGFSRWQRLRHVTLPSAVPYIATGVRISSAVALILAVTAELVIGAPGLGRGINIARQGGAVDIMYALILVTGLLGWGLNVLFARLEARVLHWHPSHRSERLGAG
jgi:ABC-type nitrate/sulfonate/bicarbonate transport system permease component